ncbi:MAG: T9SS type A sorting domain-containing protein [Calditrichaeota bacterium]|nr:T9SS type A sorting domain-containing protein [Calditrichota bacterium]
MKKTIFIITLAISLLTVFVLNSQVMAQKPHNRGGQENMFAGDRGGFWSQLTDEQKEQVQARIQELRQQGATREEIHEAVKAMLNEFGIQVPENPPQRRQGPGLRGNSPYLFELNEEQMAELRQLVQDLRQQGATRQEIREAANALVQSWGVDVPEKPGKGFRRGHKPGMGFFADLTSEQRQELRETVSGLHQKNASREEIITAVKDLLSGWGVEVPENFDERFMAGPPERGRFWKDLTDDQKQALRTEIRDMLANGAEFEAIHDAVMQQIQQWGYDVPERPDKKGFRGQKLAGKLTDEQKEQLRAKIIALLDANAEPGEIFLAVGDMLHNWGIEPPHPGFHGRRPFGPGVMSQLTEEQRQAIHDRVEELREQGATRQEIHETVRQMLEEFGVNLPEMPGNQRPGKAGDKTGYRSESDLKVTNYPNPFNPETQISYTLSNAEHVSLKIYNMQGQLIRTLIDETQSAGSHSVKWDGTNDAGEKVVSGVYLYKLQAGTDSFSRKMMLMK